MKVCGESQRDPAADRIHLCKGLAAVAESFGWVEGSQPINLHLEAEVLQLDSLDFFAHLKTMMMRRKDWLRGAPAGVMAKLFVQTPRRNCAHTA